MKKMISIICAAALCIVLLVQAVAAKTSVFSLSSMAESIERDYGALLELELTRRNDAPVYKAEIIIDGMQVTAYFDAITGTELDRGRAHYLDREDTWLYSSYDIPYAENSPGDITTAQANNGSTDDTASESVISYDRAKEIALDDVGGGSVKSIELDRERGVLVYEVEVRYDWYEYELIIDAATGEVLRSVIDD